MEQFNRGVLEKVKGVVLAGQPERLQDCLRLVESLNLDTRPSQVLTLTQGRSFRPYRGRAGSITETIALIVTGAAMIVMVAIAEIGIKTELIITMTTKAETATMAMVVAVISMAEVEAMAKHETMVEEVLAGPSEISKM